MDKKKIFISWQTRKVKKQKEVEREKHLKKVHKLDSFVTVTKEQNRQIPEASTSTDKI